jgi:hypothetical protein
MRLVASGPGSFLRLPKLASCLPFPVTFYTTFDVRSLQMETDMRRVGYISRMFGPEGAEHYITHLLGGFDYRSLVPTNSPQWPGAFFITTPIIQNATPSIYINGRPAWLLDYQIRSSGTVVPQYNRSDARRYTNATFNMPIFFVQDNRVDLGLNLIQAVAGNCGILLGRFIEASVGDCSTMYIHIKVGVFQTRTSDGH